MKAMKAKRSMKAMKVKIAKGDGGTEKKIVKDHGSTEKNSGRRLFYNRCYHNMQQKMMNKMSLQEANKAASKYANEQVALNY